MVGGFTTLIRVASLAATTMGILGGVAIKQFGSFDDAMTKSLAIMDDVTNTMRQDMVNAAMRVGAETNFAATEAADALFFLASAGLDATESLQSLPVVTDFAEAGMFNLAEATEMAFDALFSLGLNSENTQTQLRNLRRVTDVLAQANMESNATIEQFAQALTNKLGPRLRALNKSLEEGVAALAAYARAGVKGRRAGSRLNILFRDLARFAEKNEEAFEDMNIQVFDAFGRMRNLADIVEDFEDALLGLSDKQKTAELGMLGLTRRARDTLLQVLGLSDQIREFEGDMENADGAVKTLAERIRTSLLSSFNKMKGAVENLFIRAGGGLAGMVRDVTNSISDFASEEENIKLVTQAFREFFGLLFTSIGKLLNLTSTVVTKIAQNTKSVLIGAGIGGAVGGALGASGGVLGFVLFGTLGTALGGVVGSILADSSRKIKGFLNTFGGDFELTEAEKLLNERDELLEKMNQIRGEMTAGGGITISDFQGNPLINFFGGELSSEELRQKNQQLNKLQKELREITKKLREKVGLGGGGDVPAIATLLSKAGSGAEALGRRLRQGGGGEGAGITTAGDDQQEFNDMMFQALGFPPGFTPELAMEKFLSKFGQVLNRTQKRFNQLQLKIFERAAFSPFRSAQHRRRQAGGAGLGILGAIMPGGAAIQHAGQQLAGKVKKSGENAGDDASPFMQQVGRGLGRDLISGIVEGSFNLEDFLKNALIQVLNFALFGGGGLFGALGIASPSKVTMRAGEAMTEGIAVGILNKQGMVANAARSVARTAVTGLGGRGVRASNVRRGRALAARAAQAQSGLQLDFSGFPQANNPMANQRDREWQEWLRTQARMAGQDGFSFPT